MRPPRRTIAAGRRPSRPTMGFGVALMLVPTAAFAQATVAALARGDVPLTVTEPGELCWTRDADLTEVGRLAVGDQLTPGDLLAAGPCSESSPSTAGPDPEMLVVLACGDGSEVLLSGVFEALVSEPGIADCALELAAGVLDLLTDRPAELTSGGLTIGVEGTRLALLADSGDVTCLLLEGRVSVAPTTEDPSKPPIVLEGGETWSRVDGEAVRGTLHPSDRSDAEARWTRAAEARAAAAGSEALDRILLPTTHGVASVVVPRDLRAGETVSGSLGFTPVGNASAAKLVDRLYLTVGGSRWPLDAEAWHLRLPKTAGGLEVAIRKRNGKALASKTVAVTEIAMAQRREDLQRPPGLCRAGRTMAIGGSFDGDSRTTAIHVDGVPAAVLAETSRQVHVACPPPSSNGFGTVELREQETPARAITVRSVEIDTRVTPAQIRQNQPTTIEVRLTGLEGHSRRIALRVRNRTPRVVRLAGGEIQLLAIAPAEWTASGRVTRVVQGIGLARGLARIEIELVELH